jgi:hypothetical protein
MLLLLFFPLLSYLAICPGHHILPILEIQAVFISHSSYILPNPWKPWMSDSWIMVPRKYMARFLGAPGHIFTSQTSHNLHLCVFHVLYLLFIVNSLTLTSGTIPHTWAKLV